jgi:hypothetical protein
MDAGGFEADQGQGVAAVRIEVVGQNAGGSEGLALQGGEAGAGIEHRNGRVVLVRADGHLACDVEASEEDIVVVRWVEGADGDRRGACRQEGRGIRAVALGEVVEFVVGPEALRIGERGGVRIGRAVADTANRDQPAVGAGTVILPTGGGGELSAVDGDLRVLPAITVGLVAVADAE